MTPTALSKANRVEQGAAHQALKLGANPAVMIAMLILLLVAFLLVIALGSVSIPLDEVIRILLGGEAERSSWVTIIRDFRLPKAITAVLAGAALSAGGLMMQTFFRNPLADPFILGVSSGASLGVALVVLAAGSVGGTMLAGLSIVGDLSLAAAASIGAALMLLAILAAARRVANNLTLLILGVLFGQFTYAIVTLMLHFTIADRIQAYINWTFGSFSGVTWSQMTILAPVVLVGLSLAVLLSKTLNALLLGENYARSMGLHVGRARLLIIMATAMLAGVVTAFCGPIGFLGVAVPHLARGLLKTSDHRILMPASILLGGIIALAASLMADLPGSPLVLPLNAVTAFIGAPVVMWVLLRRSNPRGLGAS